MSSLLLLVLSLQVFPVRGTFQLSAPRKYVVLGGDIQVSYILPENDTAETIAGRPRTIQLESETERITAISVASGYREGVATFICGVIDYAGNFRFKLLEPNAEKTVLAQSEIMEVVWPDTNMTLPSSVGAMTAPVTLHVSVTGPQCRSLHDSVGYLLRVLYMGTNDTHGRPPKDQSKQLVVYEQEYKDILGLAKLSLTISCQKIDQAGMYQAILTSMRNPLVPLGHSTPMYAQWSTVYELRTISSSVFPCTKHVRVHYNHARCSGVEDKIRLYKQVQRTSSSINSPIDLEYVAEKRAVKAQESVAFECYLFDKEIAGYCFVYVSTALNGAVTEQYSLCLPTNMPPVPAVDGGWSSWSAWSVCSTTCGPGQRTRYRTCDNPPPTIGGQFCRGATSSFQSCDYPCKGTTTLKPITYTPDPLCECGCTTSKPNGKIVSSSKCRGSSKWTIRASPGQVIRLEFEAFTLDAQNLLTWLKVRNGDTQMSNLLVQTYGGPKPRPVISTQRTILIELMTPYHETLSTQEGFVVLYTSMAQNTTVVKGGEDDGEKGRVWESAVTIIGIALCAIIVVVTIAFVCHHRISRRRQRKEKQMTAANQALLVNGEVANSPSHSGNSFQGSANVSYGDPASSPTRRDYVIATKGVNATGDPNVDLPKKGYKVKRVRSPTKEGRQVAGDPIIIGQCPPSPYAANARRSDYIHEPDMLSAAARPPSPTKGQKRHHRGHEKDRSRGREKDGRSRHHRSSQSPSGPHGPRETSPNKGSRSRSRSKSPAMSPSGRDPRKKKSPGAPLAGEEDLSPTSPISPSHRKLSGMLNGNKMHPITENIQMDSLYDKNKKLRGNGKELSPTDIPAHRPPVEGRDSLTRKKGHRRSESPDSKSPTGTTGYKVKLPPSTGDTIPPDDIRNANVGKPNIKPLPLRGVQRPDGQSPEHQPYDPNANSPSHSYQSSGLSPILKDAKLFPDNGSGTRTPGSADFVSVADDFEYDDYVPQLPGSYFTMDPHAYTLTWSQQPPWAQKQLGASANANGESQASIDKNNSSNC